MQKRTYPQCGNRQELGACLREIFTPALWRRCHAVCREFEAYRSRWSIMALVLVGLVMCLRPEPTLRTRFRRARRAVSALCPKRRRPGKSLEGFLAACAVLPPQVWHVLREGLQEAACRGGVHPAQVGRWRAYGLDGSKQSLARTPENVAAFGLSTKEPALPQRLVAAAVALGQRLLWDWESGPGNAGEPELTMAVVRRLERGALVVRDAGKLSYADYREAESRGVKVLARVGANYSFWAERVHAQRRRGGEVWLWPQKEQVEGGPVRLRLIVLRRWVRRRVRGGWIRSLETMYLVTTELDPQALTDAEAAELYGLRWPGNEVGFRSWKQTLGHEKLLALRPAQAQVEGEFTLLGLMALQVLSVRARSPRREGLPSVAGLRDVWAAAVDALIAHESTRWLRRCLRLCVLDDYERRKPKARHPWPRRKRHRPLRPPRLLRLTVARKTRGLLMLAQQEGLAC